MADYGGGAFGGGGFVARCAPARSLHPSFTLALNLHMPPCDTHSPGDGAKDAGDRGGVRLSTCCR
jgi:hypothetical protein